MRKAVFTLLCGVCMLAFAAGTCAADVTDSDEAAAKAAGLKYYRALINGDTEKVFTLVTAEFAAEIKDPDEPKYSFLTALLLEYPQTLKALAAKTSFEFVSTDKSDDWIDVNLEVTTPDMEYVGGKIGPQMPLPDAEMAKVVAAAIAEPDLPMEKSKVELEMVLEDGAWKVAAHTEFVGEPVTN